MDKKINTPIISSHGAIYNFDEVYISRYQVKKKKLACCMFCSQTSMIYMYYTIQKKKKKTYDKTKLH